MDPTKPQLLSPDDFIISIQNFSFQQKFFKWQAYLKDLKTHQSQYYQASLQKFVEYYPFNHTYWAQLLDLMLKMPKGKINTLKMYQVALAKNPRCITLWKKYLDWLKKQLIRSDPNYLRGQLENASKIVGNHYKASFIFQYYNEVQPNLQKRFTMLKKAMVSPLQNLQPLKQHLFSLIDSQQFLPLTLKISQSQQLPIPTNPTNQSLHILQQQLKSRMSSLYEPTRLHVQQRQQYEKKVIGFFYYLQIFSDQYLPYGDSVENWRQYIGFVKQSGNSQFLPSIYERALINQCDNQALWEEYFLLLENQGNHQRALYLLRFHSLFFRNMSTQLTFYWLQIEQRDNPTHCRQLYLQLQQSPPLSSSLQLFTRHIQMQLRGKNFPNAKILYETILTLFTSNLSIIAHTVLQYADFSVRYFRDVQFAKKLLQNYFYNYGYCQFLFMGVLEFYDRNVQYREGGKEAKEVVDQYVDIVVKGLGRVWGSKDYGRVKRIVLYRMRGFITNIYLIKAAERKIIQQEYALKKEKEVNGKRDRENDGLQPNPQKRMEI